jgi:hypothetical protein
MATSYEAIVRFEVPDVGPGQESDLLQALRLQLPPPAVAELVRTDGGVLAEVRLLLDANDASQVQRAARQRCQDALRESGLAGRVGVIEDVDVRAST